MIQFWRKLIDDGEVCLPITDKRMTRFWITLDKGVDFVLKSLERTIGGEIFVPKLPSMNIVDLAYAVRPDCKTKTVGIRPGEKLHEVMIPLDDARNTLEFDEYFVIEPSFQFWSRQSYQDKYGGKEVAEDFEYSSNTNEWILSVNELQKMIG